MALRGEVGVVDTMVTFPAPASVPRYELVQGSLGQYRGDPTESPVAYLFRNSLSLPEGRESIEYTLAEMDRFGIERGVVDLGFDPVAPAALEKYPERFIGITHVDPNEGM